MHRRSPQLLVDTTSTCRSDRKRRDLKALSGRLHDNQAMNRVSLSHSECLTHGVEVQGTPPSATSKSITDCEPGTKSNCIPRPVQVYSLLAPVIAMGVAVSPLTDFPLSC